MITKPCIDCGRLAPSSPCPPCKSKRQAKRDRRRGTSAQRGYDAAWQRIRAQVLAEEPTCRWCGAPSTQADHITPKANGGTDDRENLAGSCGRCNAARGGKTRRGQAPPRGAPR